MKQFLISLSITLVIFTIHLLFISHNILVPFLATLLFIYLYGKNHVYVALHSYLLLLLIFVADRLNFATISGKTELAYATVVFLMTFIFVFIYQEMAAQRMSP